MSIKTDKAAQNHQKGYNCAQAVACAFAEEMGIDESIIFKMMEGHGLGMGCMEGTCGAITGAVAVIGAMTKLIRHFRQYVKWQHRKRMDWFRLIRFPGARCVEV